MNVEDGYVRLSQNVQAVGNLQNTSVSLKLAFDTPEEGIDFIIALSRFNLNSVKNSGTIKYLIRYLSVVDTTELIKKIISDEQTILVKQAFVTIISTVKDINVGENLIYRELLQHIVDNYSDKLNISVTILRRVVVYSGIQLLDIFEHLQPQMEELLYNMIIEPFTSGSNNSDIVFDYLIEKGVSLNYTFKKLFEDSTTGVIQYDTVYRLLRISGPSAVDPNMVVRFKSIQIFGPIWVISILFDDYNMFKVFIDRGANIWYNCENCLSLNQWFLIFDASINPDYDELGLKDIRFFEYLSEVGFNLSEGDELIRNLNIFVVIQDTFDNNDYTLDNDAIQYIKELEKYIQNLVNLGMDPRNATDLYQLEEGAEICNDVFNYIREYDYSLRSISLFSMNRNGVSTQNLPGPIRQGDVIFDFVKVISDNLQRYAEA